MFESYVLLIDRLTTKSPVSYYEAHVRGEKVSTDPTR